jgi:hypothetical protein
MVREGRENYRETDGVSHGDGSEMARACYPMHRYTFPAKVQITFDNTFHRLLMFLNEPKILQIFLSTSSCASYREKR